MRYIGFERELEAIEWAKKVIGIEGPTGFCRALSMVNGDGSFGFVTVLSNFSQRNVDMHTACEGTPTPRAALQMFNGAFGYAFDQLGAYRVTGLVRAGNAAARKFDEHLGFKFEGLMRGAFSDGEDLVIYGFLRDEYHAHKWNRRHA